MKKKIVALLLFATLGVWANRSNCLALEKRMETRPVDLVIALDVSNSMDGLIHSAKQRLWEIVGELAEAKPLPDLRVAILTYGNPSYGNHSGYVKLNLPFTRDLDAVNEALFAFGTNGGDEYVSRVISSALSSLEWSSAPDGMRLIVVAGNEAATQDPQITYQEASKRAVNKSVVVNTIYCGSATDSIVEGWRAVATLTDGVFSSIDQNAAAKPIPPTPMDKEIIGLNQELNKTYLAYGARGRVFQDNQVKQDRNAAVMSEQALASRVAAKSKGLYKSNSWDLVDAVKSGLAVEKVGEEELPVEMRKMTKSEREKYINEQTGKREEIKKKINQLEKERRAYLKNIRDQEKGEQGLDQALLKAVRSQAEKKGFKF